MQRESCAALPLDDLSMQLSFAVGAAARLCVGHACRQCLRGAHHKDAILCPELLSQHSGWQLHTFAVSIVAVHTAGAPPKMSSRIASTTFSAVLGPKSAEMSASSNSSSWSSASSMFQYVSSSSMTDRRSRVLAVPLKTRPKSPLAFSFSTWPSFASGLTPSFAAARACTIRALCMTCWACGVWWQLKRLTHVAVRSCGQRKANGMTCRAAPCKPACLVLHTFNPFPHLHYVQHDADVMLVQLIVVQAVQAGDLLQVQIVPLQHYARSYAALDSIRKYKLDVQMLPYLARAFLLRPAGSTAAGLRARRRSCAHAGVRAAGSRHDGTAVQRTIQLLVACDAERHADEPALPL